MELVNNPLPPWNLQQQFKYKTLFSITRRQLCLLGMSNAPLTNNSGSHQCISNTNNARCWCGCKRRLMISSFVGTMLTAATSNVKAQPIKEQDYLREMELIHPKKPDWYEELYAKTMAVGMKSYEAEVARYKEELFEEIKTGPAKTILELGVGTGPNLKFYTRPNDMNVIGIDPNEKMEKYARASAHDAGLPEAQFKFIHAVGEVIPLPTSSVDSVVCTLVLCSVKDVALTLKEVERVLKPGGKFYFLEHVAAQEGSTLRFWQTVLDPIQQLVADGCHLTRDTLSYLRASDFESITAKSIIVNNASLISPHLIGYAKSY